MTLEHIPSTEAALDLHLNNVPLDLAAPELLYEELLNIHTALEILLTALAGIDQDSVFSYIAKQRNVTATGDVIYAVLVSDGLILLSGLNNTCTAALPLAGDVEGHRYTIKCIDDTHTTAISTEGIETIDGSADDFQLWKHEVIEIQSDGTNWHIR